MSSPISPPCSPSSPPRLSRLPPSLLLFVLLVVLLCHAHGHGHDDVVEAEVAPDGTQPVILATTVPEVHASFNNLPPGIQIVMPTSTGAIISASALEREEQLAEERRREEERLKQQREEEEKKRAEEQRQKEAAAKAAAEAEAEAAAKAAAEAEAEAAAKAAEAEAAARAEAEAAEQRQRAEQEQQRLQEAAQRHKDAMDEDERRKQSDTASQEQSHNAHDAQQQHNNNDDSSSSSSSSSSPPIDRSNMSRDEVIELLRQQQAREYEQHVKAMNGEVNPDDDVEAAIRAQLQADIEKRRQERLQQAQRSKQQFEELIKEHEEKEQQRKLEEAERARRLEAERQRDEDLLADQRRADAQREAARIEAERNKQEQDDALRAEAARQYAAQVAKTGEQSSDVRVFDASEAVFQALQASNVWQELSPHNAWAHVQSNRPFVIILLCRCQQDDDWQIAEIDRLLHEKSLATRATYLYTLPETAQRFSLYQVFGVQFGQPHIVIDNIPIGQHVEKYLMPHRVSAPTQMSPSMFVAWMGDFFTAPTPLQLVRRSHGTGPQLPFEPTPGHVVDVNGDTYEDVVLRSPYSVLILLYSPHCPGCHNAQPVFTSLAASLAHMPNLVIARMDRTENDTPNVLPFDHYPAIFLYVAGAKHKDTSVDGGEEYNQRGRRGSRGWAAPIDYYGPDDNPRTQQSCSAPIHESSLRTFVEKYLGGTFLPMGSFGFSNNLNSDSNSNQGASANNDADGSIEDQYEKTIQTEAQQRLRAGTAE